MRICVFGADGRTGVEVVNHAKDRGFEVVAFVYGDGSRRYFSEHVTVIKGDVMNSADVLSALDGVQAVVSVLGHIKGSDVRMQTKGIKNITKAMRVRGIRRILSLTGTGAREAGDSPSLLDRVLNLVVAIVDKERIADGIEHVSVLKKSDLDWTVVRVLKLGSGQKGPDDYALTDGGPAEPLSSRRKVARALVDLIDDKTYYGKLPVISG